MRKSRSKLKIGAICAVTTLAAASFIVSCDPNLRSFAKHAYTVGVGTLSGNQYYKGDFKRLLSEGWDGVQLHRYAVEFNGKTTMCSSKVYARGSEYLTELTENDQVTRIFGKLSSPVTIDEYGRLELELSEVYVDKKRVLSLTQEQKESYRSKLKDAVSELTRSRRH